MGSLDYMREKLYFGRLHHFNLVVHSDRAVFDYPRADTTTTL